MLTLLSPLARADAKVSPLIADGLYASTTRLKLAGSNDTQNFWSKRVIEFKGNQVELQTLYFERDNPQPVIERKTKGPFTLTKNANHDKILNLDIKLSESTILVKKKSFVGSFLNIQGCTTIGVPADLIKQGCGVFFDHKGATQLYLVIVVLDEKSILLSLANKTERLRAEGVGLSPLIRKP